MCTVSGTIVLQEDFSCFHNEYVKVGGPVSLIIRGMHDECFAIKGTVIARDTTFSVSGVLSSLVKKTGDYIGVSWDKILNAPPENIKFTVVEDTQVLLTLEER